MISRHYFGCLSLFVLLEFLYFYQKESEGNDVAQDSVCSRYAFDITRDHGSILPNDDVAMRNSNDSQRNAGTNQRSE